MAHNCAINVKNPVAMTGFFSYNNYIRLSFLNQRDLMRQT